MDFRECIKGEAKKAREERTTVYCPKHIMRARCKKAVTKFLSRGGKIKKLDDYKSPEFVKLQNNYVRLDTMSVHQFLMGEEWKII